MNTQDFKIIILNITKFICLKYINYSLLEMAYMNMIIIHKTQGFEIIILNIKKFIFV